MTKHSFGRINNRDAEISFDGEALSTDGGLILIDKLDKKQGCLAAHDRFGISYAKSNRIARRIIGPGCPPRQASYDENVVFFSATCLRFYVTPWAIPSSMTRSRGD
jgi:hypothetical protein